MSEKRNFPVAKLNEHFSGAGKEGEAGGSPPFKSKKERDKLTAPNGLRPQHQQKSPI
jgi:hypothetical protein